VTATAATAGEGRPGARGWARLWRRTGEADGVTLVEMLTVLVILGIVLGALTQVFLSGTKAQLEQTRRFDAQQNARLALDGLRREIHCATDITDGVNPLGAFDSTAPRTSITLILSSACPTANAPVGVPEVKVTWCTLTSGTQKALWRIPGNACPATVALAGAAGGVRKADHLTTGQVFRAYEDSGTAAKLLGKLTVRLPVDADPNATGGVYTLEDDIVLRNTSRA
jgi:prepilin-type N-terminal cleavage/methylation domain-containing protein